MVSNAIPSSCPLAIKINICLVGVDILPGSIAGMRKVNSGSSKEGMLAGRAFVPLAGRKLPSLSIFYPTKITPLFSSKAALVSMVRQMMEKSVSCDG